MEGVIYYLAVIEMAPLVDRHPELAAMSPKTQPHTCTWQLRKGRQWCDPGIPSDIQTAVCKLLCTKGSSTSFHRK